MSKGDDTRALILRQASDLASEVGISGLTLGALAERSGLSKSGLFAHFGSKEELQLATVRAVQTRFVDDIVRPALAHPRGLVRLRALFDGWLQWIAHGPFAGSCPLLAAASEFDDQPGPIRTALVDGQIWQRDALIRALELAITSGELPPSFDCAQAAFELRGLLYAAHHDLRLLDDPHGIERAQRGFVRVIAARPGDQ